MNSDEAFAAIDAIANESSKNGKQALLAEYLKDEFFRDAIVAGLNPFITYGIKQLPKTTEIESCVPDGTIGSGTLSILLDDLASRRLTGMAAYTAVRDEMMMLSTESAELLRRIILKDFRAGFTENSVNKVRPGTIPIFKCMLAQGYDPERIKSWPVAVQPKLDGVRCVAHWTYDSIKFFSRTGKELGGCQFIEEDLKKLLGVGVNLNHPFFPPMIFDGELMSGEFNKTVGDVHREDFDGKSMVFYVFDMLTMEEFEGKGTTSYLQRNERLTTLLKDSRVQHVHRPIVLLAQDHKQVLEHYRKFREMGFEGAIVKLLTGDYVPKRSYNWMKMKDVRTADVIVKGMEKGTGKYENSLGALVVDFHGREVRVGSGLTDVDRETFWKNPDSIMGYLVEVEYHEVTPDGSLRHPRFIRIRIDKPVEDGVGV